MFTRLLTTLAGVTYGSTVWRIPFNDWYLSSVCRNQFEFVVNDSLHLILSEFSKYIRIDCALDDNAVIADNLYFHIASTLDVQLQRIVPRWIENKEFTITFLCKSNTCLTQSSHFVSGKDVIFQSDKFVNCSGGSRFQLHPSQAVWLKSHSHRDQSSELFEESLKDGYLNLSTASIMFVGADHAGCTGAKHLVFQESVPTTLQPTQLVKHEIFFRAEEDPTLRKVQPYSYDQIASYSLHETYGEPTSIKISPEEPTTPITAVTLDAQNSATHQVPGASKSSAEIGDERSVTESLAVVTPSTPHSLVTTSSEEPPRSATTPTSLVARTSAKSNSHKVSSMGSSLAEIKYGHNTDLKSVIKSMSYFKKSLIKYNNGKINFFHSFDCGSNFLQMREILKIFIKNVALCTLVADCSKSLHQNEIGLLQDNESFAQKGLIIGSHSDLVSSTTEPPNKLAMNVLGRDFVLKNGSEDIFAINCLNPQEPDRATAASIVDEKLGNLAVTRKFPFSWYLLGFSLLRAMSDGVDTLSVPEECMTIAKELQMDRPAVEAALEHLTEQNMILYFRDILNDVVFSGVNFFSQFFTRLFNTISQRTTRSENELWKLAIVSESHLNDIALIFKYTAQNMSLTNYITLFMKLQILAPYDGANDTYLLSCLLPILRESDISRMHFQKSSLSAPVIIQCPSTGYEFMCMLVIFLLTQTNGDWKVLLDASGAPLTLFKNCVKFEVLSTGYIVVISFSSGTLKVTVEHPKQETQFLWKVGDIILKGLEMSRINLSCHKAFEFRLSYQCPCKFPEHTATYNRDKDCVSCVISSEEVSPLHYDKWLRAGTMHLGSLSVSNIVKTLHPWSERWINVAELLRVPTAVISRIRVITTRQESQDTALYKVVEWWFKNSPNPEWTAISEVAAAVEFPQSIPPGKVHSAVESSLCTDISTPSQRSSKTIVSESTKFVDAFKSQRDVLADVLQYHLPDVASKLYTKSIISAAVLAEAMNQVHMASVRTVSLLSVVEDKIRAKPHVFTEFVRILESEPTLRSLAKELYDKGNPPPTPIAVSTAVAQFSADLKAKYKCCPISSDKWPPTPSKEYIKLAVVQSHSACREDYIGRVLEGNIIGRDNITEEQILDLCVEQVGKGRVIVIEGAPGIGKSTLAWELCRKWEEYASMEAYSLVILLRLREERVHNISDLSSLFYAYQKSDKMSLVDEVQNNQGKGVLFVFDGFNELPKLLQREGFLVDLLQKSILPKSTVVVTSRPSAMDKLLTISEPVIEKRIEILGFSQESIEAYAAAIFSSSEELEGFKSYISRSSNPAINSLMYVPLYAAFVVIMYKSTTSKGSLPRTITQLYTQLCLAILNRYLGANTEHSSVRNFENLPSSLYVQFIEVSKLAYEGFEREDVIFYDGIGEHFGFLDAVPDLYGGRQISFNFLHLTFQEFLAAYHISHMSDSGVELFRNRGKDKRWNVVWRFVAGLRGSMYLDSSSVGVWIEDDRLSVFFIQCLFEAQRVKIDFQSTFRKDMSCAALRNCASLDYYALGFCIANCTTAESSWKVVFVDTSSDQIYTFTQGLMTNTYSTGVIKLLHVGMDPIAKTNCVKYLHECMFTAATSPLCSIINLSMYSPLTSNVERIQLFELISNMPHLQKLDISWGDLRNAPGSPYCACRDTDGLLKFLQYLTHSKVTSLDIRHTGLEYFLEQSPLAQDYCAAIQALISPPSNLRELRIHPHDDSCHEGSLTLIGLVSSPSTLRKLYLELSGDCFLLNAFETNNHIAELEIVYLTDHSSPGENWPALVPDVVRIIQHNTTLETLKLEELDYHKDDILRDIATAVQSNKTLRHVHITLRIDYGDQRDETQLEKTLQAIDPRITLSQSISYA